MDNLNTSGQLPQPVFSFRFSTTPGESELIIGDVNNTAFNNNTLVNVPVTRKAYWEVRLDKIASPTHDVQESMNAPAIIDTGTTLILGPRAIVYDYYSDVSGSKCRGDGVCTGASRLDVRNSLDLSPCSSMQCDQYDGANTHIWGE